MENHNLLLDRYYISLELDRAGRKPEIIQFPLLVSKQKLPDIKDYTNLIKEVTGLNMQCIDFIKMRFKPNLGQHTDIRYVSITRRLRDETYGSTLQR